MTSDQIAERQREIKRELRLIAADPSAPGAAMRVQTLKGEYRRLAQELGSRGRAAPAPEPELTEADRWRQVPGVIGERIRKNSMARVITPWHD